MSDTYTELRAIVKDLLGADEAKITMEARFREDAQKITTVGEAVKYIDARKK